MLYLVIFFVIIATLIALSFLRITVYINATKNKKTSLFVITISVLRGIIKLKYRIPFIDLTEEGVTVKTKQKKPWKKKEKENKDKIPFTTIFDAIKVLIKKYKKNNEMICSIREYARRKFVLKVAKLNVVIGVGEAHYTAVISGMLWALYGSFIGILSNFIRIDENKVTIKSDFNGTRLLIDLHCIIHFRIVHIIVIGLKLLYFYLKGKLVLKNNIVGGGVIG